MKTKLIFTIALAFFGLSANAQWVRQIGATGEDAVRDCVLDKDKNIYVTGSYQGTVDFGNGQINSSVNSGVDYFTAKYDQNNNCLWTVPFGTTDRETGSRIFLDETDNSVYSAWRIITPSPGCNTYAHGLGKIYPNGAQGWFGYFGGWPIYSDFKQSDSLIEFLIFYVAQFERYDSAGNFLDNTPFPSNTLLHLGLKKSDGSVNFFHAYNDYANAYMTSAKFDNDSIIISGGFMGSTQICADSLTATNGLTDGDAYLVKVDTAGNCGWVKQYNQGVTAQEEEAVVILVQDNRVYFIQGGLGVFTAGGFLSYYDQGSGVTFSNPSTGIGYDRQDVFGPSEFRAAKIKEGKMLLKITHYQQNSCNGYSYAGFNYEFTTNGYDLNTLAEDNTFITFPAGADVSVESFASDSLSLYLAGRFQGNADFNGTSLATVPSNVDDGYVFKKDYCFYPPAVPTILASGATAFCQGGNVTLTASAASSYLWSNGDTTQNIVVSSSGNYSVTVTDGNGCSAISSATAVTVHPVYSESVAVSICAGESYIFGTQTLSVSGNYNETFSSVNGCDSTVALALTVHTVYSESAVAYICAGESYTFGLQTLSVSGNYNETFSSMNGCDSTVALALTVHALPVNTVSVADASSCSASDGSVTANVSGGASPYTYLWSNGDTTSGITGLAPGTYTLTVTDANGCAKISSAAVNCPSGVAVQPAGPNDFIISPNPNNGTMIINYNISENQEIQFYNLVGEKVAHYHLERNGANMFILESSLKDGIYIYQLSNEAMIIKRGKIVVIK